MFKKTKFPTCSEQQYFQHVRNNKFPKQFQNNKFTNNLNITNSLTCSKQQNNRVTALDKRLSHPVYVFLCKKEEERIKRSKVWILSRILMENDSRVNFWCQNPAQIETDSLEDGQIHWNMDRIMGKCRQNYGQISTKLWVNIDKIMGKYGQDDE